MKQAYIIIGTAVLIAVFVVVNKHQNIVTADTRLPTMAQNELFTMSESELVEYEKVYQDPFVKHVRVALDNYVNGSTEGIANVAISSVNEDGSPSGLKAFSNDYYRSKFVVASINDGIFGGEFISIVFQDKPDKVFDAWVYSIDPQTYELRAFSQDKSFDESKMESYRQRYNKILEDKQRAI